MGKTAEGLEPTITRDLTPQRTTCPHCERPMRTDYVNRRAISTRDGVTRLNRTIRRCRHESCAAVRRPDRPEAEGRMALPRHEFALDVIALVGRPRYREQRSVPEIRAHPAGRGVQAAERTVLDLLDRCGEWLAVVLTDDQRRRRVLAAQERVIVGIDGLQPDVGHDVRWVVRDCLSGEILAARAMLSARREDRTAWLEQVKAAGPVPLAGIVSDGQHAIRQAVAAVLPAVSYQLCPFHVLREAARPIREADRHANKELEKTVRGVRRIERQVEERTDAEAEVVRGYCSAVGGARTDDGRPPLDASGRTLHHRLTAIDASLERAAGKGGGRPNCDG